MSLHVAETVLPYARQLVFDLVADIESYPLFLRHVAAARITRRDGNVLWVEQEVRVRPLRAVFHTRAVLDPPSGIQVVCADSPLGAFTDDWSFADAPGGGTRLRCRTEYEFRSALVRATLGAVLGEVLHSTVRAFEARARQLYGSGAGRTPRAPAAPPGAARRGA